MPSVACEAAPLDPYRRRVARGDRPPRRRDGARAKALIPARAGSLFGSVVDRPPLKLPGGSALAFDDVEVSGRLPLWVMGGGSAQSGIPTGIDGLRPRKSGSRWTRRWREMDSNSRSPVAGRGQAARNQTFRRTTGAEAYVRRNKAADRLVRCAPDQPSRNLPPRPFLFRHRRARRAAWHGADDLRWQR